MEDIDDHLPWDFNPSAHVFRTRQVSDMITPITEIAAYKCQLYMRAQFR